MSSVKVTKERVVEGPSSSVRTTTYETKSSYESDVPTYRASMTPRSTIIHRTSYGGPMSKSQQISRNMSYSYGAALPAGSYGTVANTGMKDVVDSRHKEKKDMQDLNERFASYIEKVRFLEAQNRKLADELEKLKQKWGKETTAIKAMYQAELDEARRLLDEAEKETTAIKAMYQAELDEARRLLDEAEKEKARYQIRSDTLEEQLNELREKLADVCADRDKHREAFENQNRTVIDLEAECELLRKRIESLENDRERDKKEIARLTDALNRARIDLDNETLAHIDAENKRQTLEEELEFLKSVHEQEMKELAALAYRDTTAENREFWKNEMGAALREIQSTYDEKLGGMRAELETYYNLKIQEFRTGATRTNMEVGHAKEESKRLRTQLTDLRGKLADLEARNAQLEKELELMRREYEDKEREWESENTDLKNEVAKLRAEMEAILKELQDLMDTKLGLELEIAAYRKLLEGEENRVGLRSMMDSLITSSSAAPDDSSLKVSQVVKGEMSAKTTYQRSAKGPVSISECAADGRYIALENTGRKEENLNQWVIKRIVDGNERVNIELSGVKLRAGGKCRLYASGNKPRDASANDQEMKDIDNWGIGANITTKLINPDREDRATHVQKTIYTS